MDLLVDTHALIWWWTEDERLSTSAADAIADSANRVLVSAASAWEVATKERIGKLGDLTGLSSRFGELVAQHGFIHMPINHAHAVRAGSHQAAHRDPFDRMLAAQTELDRLTLVTKDRVFDSFGVSTLW